MRSFKDAEGRTWALAINCHTIEQAEALAKVHVPSLLDDEMAGYMALVQDASRLAPILYALCKDEADRRGVSRAGFLSALYGDVLNGALEAFQGEFADFFRDPEMRELLGRAAEDVRRDWRRAMASIAEREAEARAGASTASSGDAPESSGSTPAPSPSGS